MKRSDSDRRRAACQETVRTASTMDERLRKLAERVWRYHHMDHELQKSDIILVLCSHDTTVAERGAQLFLDGWAPLLVFSGGLGAITRRLWSDPEADRFARIAIEMGVPEDRILIENRSTNTGENVAFTQRPAARARPRSRIASSSFRSRTWSAARSRHSARSGPASRCA